jgi:hypothetical protein
MTSVSGQLVGSLPWMVFLAAAAAAAAAGLMVSTLRNSF